MRTAREWVLAQPGGLDFDAEELATAVAAVEARDREVIDGCADRQAIAEAVTAIVYADTELGRKPWQIADAVLAVLRQRGRP